MRKLIVKILIVVIIMFLITTSSYAKFSTKINGKGVVQVKFPILLLEKNDYIIGEISKEKNTYTQDFCLKNYLKNGNKISEIEFEYVIKLLPSTEKFPVSYKLINLNNNEEVFVNENLETNKIFIGTKKTEHKYRLVVNWNEITTIENFDENLEVKIKIKAEQIEKEN